MRANNKGWDQCGNAQVAVDSKEQVIVACDVTNKSNDKEQLEPMLNQAEENIGHKGKIKAISADSGYYSEANVEYAEGKKIEVYIATGKLKHTGPVVKAPRGRPPAIWRVKERMTRKLRTKRGSAVYAKRKSIVEPVFGQIKRARGFLQFSLRGLKKMRGEWALVCLTHNLLKLFRTQQAAMA